jgi:hypothetical protein
LIVKRKKSTRVLELQTRSSAHPLFKKKKKRSSANQIYRPPHDLTASHRRTPSSHQLLLLLCPHRLGTSLLGVPCQHRRREAGGPCLRNCGRRINPPCARRAAPVEGTDGAAEQETVRHCAGAGARANHMHIRLPGPNTQPPPSPRVSTFLGLRFL